MEPVSDILETFLDFLCGRFQGLLLNVAPTTYLRLAVGASDDAVVCEIRFSDECLAAAIDAAKGYRNRDRIYAGTSQGVCRCVSNRHYTLRKPAVLQPTK